MNHTFKQHILFDDTLIHDTKYFNLVLDEFDERIHRWLGDQTVSTAEIRQKQIEFNIAQVSRIGFKSSSFPDSLIETYRFFCKKFGRPAHREEEKQLMKLGLSVYEHEIEPYPGMADTLETLRREGHRLYLYTGGEASIQQRKIDRLKLSAYFDDRIYITQHKNESTLEQILEKGLFDRSSTWMIGNSMRTDIVPALTAGLHSIYIKQPNEWEYNVVELHRKPASSFFTVFSITDVPRIIDLNLKKKQNPNYAAALAGRV